MRETDFRAWLDRRFAPNVAGSRLANCRTVERVYGNLDDAIDSGQLSAIIDELTYSTADERSGRPKETPNNVGVGDNSAVEA
jgi:hypothetical protein